MTSSRRSWESPGSDVYFSELDQSTASYARQRQPGTWTNSVQHSDSRGHFSNNLQYAHAEGGIPNASYERHGDATYHAAQPEQPAQQYMAKGPRRRLDQVIDELGYNGTGLDLSKSLRGGGGDPQRTNSGRIRTRFPITMARDDLGNATIKEKLARHTEVAVGANSQEAHDGGSSDLYFPFGKPGAGAPLRSDDGKVSPRIKGKMQFEASADARNRKRRAASTYLAVLKTEIAERENREHEMLLETKKEADTLADVMRRGRVGNPKRDPETGLLQNQHNPTSDVTKYKTGQSQPLPKNTKEYHTDLAQLAEERHRNRLTDKLRDKYEEVNHERHWSEYWGKPGGGAPQQNLHEGSHKKANLNNMLFGSHQSDNIQIKNTGHGIQEIPLDAHHHRSHIASKHSNLYQTETYTGRKMVDQRSYALTAPFATHEALVENGV